jgi:hypothetical protein
LVYRPANSAFPFVKLGHDFVAVFSAVLREHEALAKGIYRHIRSALVEGPCFLPMLFLHEVRGLQAPLELGSFTIACGTEGIFFDIRMIPESASYAGGEEQNG